MSNRLREHRAAFEATPYRGGKSLATSLPRVSFGMIVLNGEPFVRYNLRALYPFAHQIIVVEGAAPGAAAIALDDGHSKDRTLLSVREFMRDEDGENKVILVTAEDLGHPDGFWPGEKDEQSRAYARLASGDYLWQVDVDEFYRQADMQAVLQLLVDTPDITAVSFKQITFWGGFDYVADGWYLRRGAGVYHRLFKWGEGYQYATHRPPTICDAAGRDVRRINPLAASETAKRGIFLYHYSLVFPKQVQEKCQYYRDADWARRARAMEWAEDVFVGLRRPYRVHNVYEYPSWLERFRRREPEQIAALRDDMAAGIVQVDVRPTEDIERLLASRRYLAGRALLRCDALMWLDRMAQVAICGALSLVRSPRKTLSRLGRCIGRPRSIGRM